MSFEDKSMAAVRSEIEGLIIGAGFSGLCMGIGLRTAGLHDFLILDRASEVGGTWRDNHYPGCACDIPSLLYSYSFEPNPDWTRLYAPQSEIKAYLQHCARKYGLQPHLRLGEELATLSFDERADRWDAVTTGGTRYRARWVVSGMGALSRPAYPKITGIERFKGTTFHSAEWRHDHDLTGKRVAVIGTGASAVQFVPQIAPRVARLDVYQRTAPWIMSKADRPIHGWERALFRRIPMLQRWSRLAIYWRLESRLLGFLLSPTLMRFAARKARRQIERQVANPELRRKVTPDYAFGCKRILLSDDFYPALCRSNVSLVTESIREVTEDSILTAEGQQRPVDAIIFGTGFQTRDLVPHGVVRGVGGVELHERWPNGPEAFLGVSVAGFPNLFFLLGPNTGLAHNSMVYMIEAQVRYVLGSLSAMKRAGWSRVDVRPEAQRRFNESLQSRMKRTIWSSGCQSWYLNEQGRNTLLWPGFTFNYRRLTSRFRPRYYVCETRPESVT